jgi:hypothetical protein
MGAEQRGVRCHGCSIISEAWCVAPPGLVEPLAGDRGLTPPGYGCCARFAGLKTYVRRKFDSPLKFAALPLTLAPIWEGGPEPQKNHD